MRRATDILLISLFAIVIGVFAVGLGMSSRARVSVTEKRRLAGAPKLHWKTIGEFPAEFDTFARDRMAYRTDFVHARNLLKYDLWHVSGSPTVLVGSNGWLYYLGEKSAEIFRHEQLFTPQQLEQWRCALKHRSDVLAKRGIKYVFVAAPDKPTIYPEFLPAGFGPIRPQSRLQQLTAYLQKDPSITFINLSDSLVAHKELGPLYLKTDTHWNDLGAYVAYTQLINTITRWMPELTPLPVSQIGLAAQECIHGDCLGLMGLLGSVSEVAPTQHLKLTVPKNGYRALILHDSFGDALKPYLNSTFGDVKWSYHSDFPLEPELVDATKPNIVIQEMVERHLSQIVPEASDRDWRDWLTKAMLAAHADNCFVNIMPSTHSINAVALGHFCQRAHLNIKPTTSRVWTESGDSVTFDPKAALYSSWYLLKTGEQGNTFVSPAAEFAYHDLEHFVANSGKFVVADKYTCPDGSICTLYKRAG